MTEPAGTETLYILGLFDNERAADDALSQLAVQEMTEGAIKVVDQADLDTAGPAIPYPAFKAGASLGPLRPKPETPPGAEPARGIGREPRRELQQVLQELNLGAEEAEYYAGGVYDGGTLIVVQAAGAAKAAEVRQLLRAAGAANFGN